MSSFVIYTDGASRGNPGPASLGVVILDEKGNIVKEISETLGDQTNNFAEYTAVIRGLEEAISLGAKKLTVRSDSQLLVRQLCGQYKVKSSVIMPLFRKCKELIAKIEEFNCEHIPREENEEADRLANLALDRDY